jgi:hypothetical protein
MAPYEGTNGWCPLKLCQITVSMYQAIANLDNAVDVIPERRGNRKGQVYYSVKVPLESLEHGAAKISQREA